MQLQVVAEAVADFTTLFKLHLPIDVVLDWPIPSSRFLLRHSTGRVSQPKAHIHSQCGSGTAERRSEPRCACYAGARSAASVCTSVAALATVPTYGFATDRPSATLDRLRKLDMERHCKWIVNGTDGLGGRGCTRMRPTLLLPGLGHVFRVTGVMA